MKKSFSFNPKRSISSLLSVALLATIFPVNSAFAEEAATAPVEQASSTLSDTATTTDSASIGAENPENSESTTDESVDTQEIKTEPVIAAPQPGTEQSFDSKRDNGQSGIKAKPDNQTGAATLSYPFTIPQGRASLTPSLSLNYNSQNEESAAIFGFGWSISIPSISRIARKGVDKLYTQNFYESSLSGELKPIDIADGTHGTYGAENDFGDFLSYEFNIENQWIVKDKNGNTYTFGKDASSNQDNPSDDSQVFKWMLSEIRDSNNNFVRYEYAKDSGQIYPSRIVYTGNGSVDGIYEIVFLNESRLDKNKSFSTGFEVDTNRRINEIDVKVNGQAVRKYTLSYASGNNKYRSILASITESGKNDSGSWQTFPDTTFEYTGGPAGWEKDTSYTIPEYFYNTGSNEYVGIKLTDVNGDGYVDILKSVTAGTPSNSVYINKKDGTGWQKDTNYNIPISFYDGDGYINKQQSSFDINGDGLEDLFLVDGENRKIYLGAGQAPGWTQNEEYDFSNIQFCAGCDREEGVRTFDVNGDGMIDFLKSYGYYMETQWVKINNGDTSGWTQDDAYTIPITFAINSDTPDTIGTQIFDVNADGLTDLLQSTNVSGLDVKNVYLNKGDGTGWSNDSEYDIPVLFYDRRGNDYRSVRISDVNGDGMTDILRSGYASGGAVVDEVYINKGSGDGWQKDTAYDIPASFCYSGCEAYPWGTHLVDVNGDGMTDIVESNFSGGNGTQNVYINKGEKPDLLSAIHSSEGADTEIVYKPTTAYKAGSDLENPKLPTIIYTVSSITTNDGFGATSETNYEYEGGQHFFNGPYDRKFAGFEKTTTIDPDGNKAIKYFHQGNGSASQIGEYLDQKAKIDLVYRSEIYNASGKLFQVILNKWDRTDLGNERNFVFKGQTIQKDYDGNSTHRDRAQTFTYDSTNGNLTRTKNWGEVTAADDGTFTDIAGDSTATDYTYATGATNPKLSLVSSELTKNNSGVKVGETRHYYDGLAFGSAILGNLTRQENWISGSAYAATQHAYNSYGMVTSDIDPRSNTTSYTYDSYNIYPSAVINALNQSTVFTYDYSSGQPLTVIDPNGAKITYTYDAFDRPLTQKQSDFINPSAVVLKTEYIYNDNFPKSIIQKNYLDSSNHADRYIYFDGFDRVIQERTEAEGSNFSVKDTVYDDRGLVEKTSLPYFSNGSARTNATNQTNLCTSFTYDALGRPLTVTDATGTVDNDYDQWALTTTDQLSHKKDFQKDAYGRLVTVAEHNSADSYTTNYTYDALGNLTKLTDALGNIRNFTYDAISRRTKAEDLHAPADTTFGIWNYVYDTAGNMLTAKDPRGMITNYTYDKLNRVLKEDYPGTTYIEYSYIYDTCENGKGQLCAVSGYSGTFNTSYNYFPLGLKKSEKRTISVTVFNQSTSFTYDRLGNPLIITYPDTTRVAYTYDSAGQLETVATKLYSQSLFQPLINSVEYSPLGQTTKMTYANGTVTTNTYDANSLYRLTQKLTQKGSQVLQKLDYTIDSVGNITKIVDSSATVSVGGVNASLAKISNFTYDDLYRLISATITNSVSGQNYTQTYAYNAVGNITNKSDVGSYTYAGNTGTNYANPHAVTTAGAKTYTYDNAGNVLNDGVFKHNWDYRGRIAYSSSIAAMSIPPVITYVQYKYDQEGNRLQKATIKGGITKNIYYVNQYYDRETDDTKLHVYAGSEKVATFSGRGAATLSYHHPDHLSGSSVETDRTGAVIELTDYYPFGTIRFDKTAVAYPGNTYKFTGKELDVDTVLYYYGARYYNPSIGRFISQDPIFLSLGDKKLNEKIRGGIIKLLSTPQAFNSYSYTLNNPVRYTDPTGECIWDLCFAETAIVVTAAVTIFTYAMMQTDAYKNAVYSLLDSGNNLQVQGSSSGNSGQNNNGNNKNPFTPEKIIPTIPIAQQAKDSGFLEKSKAVMDWFAEKGISLSQHAANRLSAPKLGDLGVTPNDVLNTFQNGQKYLDNKYSDTYNRIIEYGDKYLRVAIDSATNAVNTIVVDNKIDPGRFTLSK